MTQDPHTTELVVRPVRPEEYAEVGAMVEAAYAAGGLLDNDRGYGEHVRDVAGRAPDHPVLVAERDGHIVGSVTITPPRTPQSELADPDELEFRYLAVAPSAWRSGVANALVAAVDEHAVAAGARRLVIFVISTNEAAHRLYDRLGFVRAPHRDWSPDAGVDLWAFERPVPWTPSTSAP